MPEQLPKEIINLISDRAVQLEAIKAYTDAIRGCLGKVPAYILSDFVATVTSFNRSIESLELELKNKGYAFNQLAVLTEIVDEIEREKGR